MVKSIAYLKSVLTVAGLFGVRRQIAVSLRETARGYIIRSAQPGTSGCRLAGPARRHISFTLWAAVVALWLVAVPVTVKVSATLALMVLSAVVLARRLRWCGHEVRVDTGERVFTVLQCDGAGRMVERARLGFDEVADLMLQRRPDDDGDCRLCLRPGDGRAPVPVCLGPRATLLAIHDRLGHDLRPAEERMAINDVRSALTPRQRMRAAFPLLAPEETFS